MKGALPQFRKKENLKKTLVCEKGQYWNHYREEYLDLWKYYLFVEASNVVYSWLPTSVAESNSVNIFKKGNGEIVCLTVLTS